MQRVAYVVGRYPAVSHAFILREVRALRAIGVPVATLSIHRTPEDQLLSLADREEAASTVALLPVAPLELARRHVRALSRKPVAYLRTAIAALRLAPPGLKSRLWHLFYFAEAIAFWEACRRQRVRHLHAQFADNAASVAMLLARFERSSGWTWSLAVHGPVEFYDVQRYRLAEKVRDATFVQTISHFGRSQILSLLDEEEWDKVSIVRCGVDPARFTTRNGARPDAPRKLSILYVGRLVSLKGQSILVDAVHELRLDGYDIEATIVGDGPRREPLHDRVQRLGLAEHVTFTGAIGQDEMPSLYPRFDVFCLPSFGEGIPVVLMEAMASGTPVVTTRIMGVPELVEDGETGLLTAPGSVAELVEALRRLADDVALRHRLAAAGREKVLAEYTNEGNARILAELFERRAGIVAGVAQGCGDLG